MNETTTSSRVWLITGCSSGFGMALASAVLVCGQRVIATARKPATLDELAPRYPETCRVLALDVTERARVKTAVEEAAGAFGRLDVVVNNAGYGLIGALEEFGDEQIARNFDANFFGALEVIRSALGKYATDKVRMKLASTERELAAWEHVGLPTDFIAGRLNGAPTEPLPL
ncbi:MAG: SDR family NAD(P)-dependent oxidoreductase [Verrucomicrobia bacterium]|nr:SDR family NAD(P)-dependent oxidoreductase [Verrucomicrobiota bacterium]